jgi:diguanylate cyclase (GGDEF)-like protein/PAS domain S-box-containing protein
MMTGEKLAKRRSPTPNKSSTLQDILLRKVPAVLYLEKRGKVTTGDSERPSNTLVYINPEVERLLGYTAEEFLANPPLWESLVLPGDVEAYHHPRKEIQDERIFAHGEYRMQTLDKRIVWVRDEAVVSYDTDEPEIALWQGVISDVTREREIRERLTYQGNFDDLTKLHNRAHLRTAIKTALFASANGGNFSLLFMDLDDFKHVNDTLGHALGDDLLIKVAGRLKEYVRAGDTVARLGGDEFAVVLAGGNEASAILVAERMNLALRETFNLDGTPVNIGVSIGISCYPDHKVADEGEMMRLADLAMYQAKRTHAGVAVYDPVFDDPLTRAGLARRDELRVAVEEGQFVLFYQPLLNLHNNQIEAVEALIRWPRPNGEMLSPADFLSMAEQTGLIRQIDLFALNAACAQVAAWRAKNLDLRISINISRLSLLDEAFCAEMKALQIVYQLEGPEIEIEMTEDGAALDPRAAELFAARMTEMGVRLSIDDFGVGASSLRQFRRMQAGTVKIDKSFTKDILGDTEDRIIVEFMISLGHRFKRTVVVEGIESAEQLAMMRELGADYAQGYYLSYPLAADELLPWLQAKNLINAKGESK